MRASGHARVPGQALRVGAGYGRNGYGRRAADLAHGCVACGAGVACGAERLRAGVAYVQAWPAGGCGLRAGAGYGQA
jgi:hypothetical protein